MKKYNELFLKYKRVILVSLIGALIPVLIGFSFLEVGGLIFYYTILFAWILVFVIREDSVLEILPKLLIGSVFLGIFLLVFIFLRIQIESLIRKGHLEHFPSVGISIFLPLGAIVAYVFFAGLVGIVIYGFYRLYQKQIEKYFIYFAPIILGLFSFFIRKNEFGGTIMSRLYGWPFVMLKYNVKDIVDRTVIDQYIF